jgi:hypothetical protein
LPGCASTAEYLNLRNAQACLCGEVIGGVGVSAHVGGKLEGLIATGGATIEQCKEVVRCE